MNYGNKLIKVNNHFEAKSLEKVLAEVMAGTSTQDLGKEVPPIWTERKDGVLPQFDPRTDRWEIAQEAADTASKSHTAKRQRAIEEREKATNAEENNNQNNE
ncbi:hypothetical protein [Capybara microvirus Cap3_SP_379]|nr:hypothetical protein [Capybara microvirus Cap3_SP_379]